MSTREKFQLLGKMSAPLVLIAVVLGIIFSGVATPVEAAGIGTFGAFIVAAIHRKLDWPTIREACLTTLKASAMVIWIMFGATIFVGLYVLEGGQQFVQESIAATGLGPWGVLILMQVLLVVLGMFLDWVGILLLCVPIFVPIIKALGAQAFGLDDPNDLVLWFGVLYLVNMQMSFLSPPFGYALFYLRGVAPDYIPMTDIFKSALPFLVAADRGADHLHGFPRGGHLAATARLRLRRRHPAGLTAPGRGSRPCPALKTAVRSRVISRRMLALVAPMTRRQTRWAIDDRLSLTLTRPHR